MSSFKNYSTGSALDPNARPSNALQFQLDGDWRYVRAFWINTPIIMEWPLGINIFIILFISKTFMAWVHMELCKSDCQIWDFSFLFYGLPYIKYSASKAFSCVLSIILHPRKSRFSLKDFLCRPPPYRKFTS